MLMSARRAFPYRMKRATVASVLEAVVRGDFARAGLAARAASAERHRLAGDAEVHEIQARDRSMPAVHTPPPNRSSSGASFHVSPPGSPGRAMVLKRQLSWPVSTSRPYDEAAPAGADIEAHADDHLAGGNDRPAVQLQASGGGSAVFRHDGLIRREAGRSVRRARSCGHRRSRRKSCRRRSRSTWLASRGRCWPHREACAGIATAARPLPRRAPEPPGRCR